MLPLPPRQFVLSFNRVVNMCKIFTKSTSGQVITIHSRNWKTVTRLCSLKLYFAGLFFTAVKSLSNWPEKILSNVKASLLTFQVLKKRQIDKNVVINDAHEDDFYRRIIERRSRLLVRNGLA